jgi:OOP family OmpA-OmpF porin
MIKCIVAALSLSAVGSIALAPTAFAQSADAGSMTQEEITAAFEKQKTRGLSIAPTGQTATTEATTTAAPVTEVSMNAVPKEEQVNINIAFDFDSAALREDQKPKLIALCNAVKDADVQMLRILGHTDSSGSAEYNENLSRLRAEEVKSYLVTDCNIPSERMEAVGVGERFPYDTADPKADANRRVEFQALS